MPALRRVLQRGLVLGLVLTIPALASGCTSSKQPTTPSAISTPSTGSSIPQTDDPGQAVLLHFAELVSKGDVQVAGGLLEVGLRGAYSMDNFAPLRNTPRMEILRILDKSPQWKPDYSATDPATVTETRVYYLEVRYKVLGITTSYFKDGEIYHHKATVLHLRSGEWLISELSGTGAIQ